MGLETFPTKYNTPFYSTSNDYNKKVSFNILYRLNKEERLVEYLDYQIPVTQIMDQREMDYASSKARLKLRYASSIARLKWPPTPDHNTWYYAV